MVTKQSMFWQLTLRALIRRRLHLLIILLAIAIGVAVVAAMTNLYQNLSDQLSQQFRQYGANVVVKSKKGSLRQKEVKAVARFFEENVVAYSLFSYKTASVEQKKIPTVGVNLKQLPKLYPFWRLQGKWPQSSQEVIVGKEAALKLALKPGKTVSFTDRQGSSTIKLKKKVSAVFESGSDDEAQIFLARGSLPNTSEGQVAYFSIIGQGQKLQQKLQAAKGKFSWIKMETVSRLATTESKVLNQIRYLVWLVAFIILITTVLGVATTLASLVVERRQEIALKKALGAEDEQITREFLTESLVLGLAGGIIGWLSGVVIAHWVSRVVFNALISVSILSFLLSLTVALLVSLAAATMPVRLALKIEPAVVLKGE